MKRPTSVTAIGWFILIGGVISLASIPVTYAIPELQHAFEKSGWELTEAALLGAAAGITSVASGFGILKGWNWARWLYLVYVPFSLLLSWLLHGFEPLLFLSLPLYVVILVLLTRPAAAAFFSGDASLEPQLLGVHPVAVVRRAAGVVLLAVGLSLVLGMVVLAAVLAPVGVFGEPIVILAVAVAVAVGAGIVGAGAALWDRSRWRMVLGIALTVAGGLSALAAATAPLLMMSPEWRATGPVDEAVADRTILGYALAGLALMGLGIPLIVAQRRRGVAAAGEGAARSSGPGNRG